MQSLGPHSTSAYLRAALGVASGVLWVGFVLLIICSGAYAGSMIAIHQGWLDPAFMHSNGVKVEVSGDEKDPLDWPAITAGIAAAFIALPATIFIVRHLKSMFDTFVANDPFRAENGDHLRAIAYALIVIQISTFVEYYVEVLLRVFFKTHAHEMTFSFTFDGATITIWFVIAILFVLAQVFREGAKLRDEQNLTV
jgi:hypothetical protein